MPNRRKPQTRRNLTGDYLSDRMNEDVLGGSQRFSRRSKFNQQMKTQRTAEKRAAGDVDDVDALPIGQVVQVFSLFSEVLFEGQTRLCVVRKTLTKTAGTSVVVGDRVRFRLGEAQNTQDKTEGVIERIEPRTTVLTRADSFKAIHNHPIVANAQQMLIVASVVQPAVKWGLIDRMLIAAQSGGLKPILCLNKIDLAIGDDEAELADAREKLAHYVTLGIATLEASVPQSIGIDALRELLRGSSTVVAGHSGVGKSSLFRAVQPSLDLRIGEISAMHLKGRHTTTSARRYLLEVGGEVIDTPGVKLFGLWDVDRERLESFFPDIQHDTAPPWRIESYDRILKSLPQ